MNTYQSANLLMAVVVSASLWPLERIEGMVEMFVEIPKP